MAPLDPPHTWTAQRFDGLYAASTDPWAMDGSWYEERKRALLLASMPARRYTHAFEPGCGHGLLSAQLALRCDRLQAWDCSARALETARLRLESNNCQAWFRQACVPDQWPQEVFDLVVLSELLYYLTYEDLDQLMTRMLQGLAPQATVVACHWTHAIEGCAQTGSQVHERLHAGLSLPRVTHVRDADFVLDVWTRGEAESLALREGRA